MTRRVAALAAAVLTVAGAAGASSAQAQVPRDAGTASPAVSWGRAHEIAGATVHNPEDSAQIEAVSCTAVGTCGAGGYHSTPRTTTGVPFTTSRVSGTWKAALTLQGSNLAQASVQQISCSSAGNCSAAGRYVPAPVYSEVFVATETNGTWGQAELMPGIESINGGGVAAVNGLSCPAAGDCSAVGLASGSSGASDGYYTDETNGVWGKATDIPGLAGLRGGGNEAVATAVSCPSAGNCSAGGFYAGETGQQAFVVDRTDGTWGKAQEVPGSAALNAGGYAEITAVSCPSAGNCVAGGYSLGRSHNEQALLVTEKNGVWGTAQRVPGFAALNKGGTGQISTLSCGAAGSCAAGGYYTDSSGNQQAFVVSATNGVWGAAEEVPGTAALNTDGQAAIGSLSCSAPGNCAAGGYYDYDEGAGREQAFVVSATNGIWGTAEEVPGLAALNTGGEAQINAVSCGAANNCTAGGFYTDSSYDEQAFVVNESG